MRVVVFQEVTVWLLYAPDAVTVSVSVLYIVVGSAQLSVEVAVFQHHSAHTLDVVLFE